MEEHKAKTAVERLIAFQEGASKRKILHFGSLAGWPHTLANASRKRGIAAENVIHTYKDVLDLDRKFPFDQEIFNTSQSFPEKVLSTLKFLKDIPSQYSLIHYHSTTLLHREYHFLFEGPYFKRHQVPMILSLGGGDARLDRKAGLMNPYYYKRASFLHDLRVKLRWISWSKNVSVCATDPEMVMIARDYFDNVKIFRQPVEIERFAFNPPSKDKDVPLLLHVPTNPQIKGTEYIVKAVEDLKRKGLKFKFKLVRQLTQEELFREINECDVYIDQLRCGTHGMTAVETMAMGKPTISWIRDNLVSSYPPDCPIVSANPDTIQDVLEKLIKDAQLRYDIGIQGRRYVEKYHDTEVVLEDLSQIYIDQLQKHSSGAFECC